MKKSIVSLIACSTFVSLFLTEVNAQEFTTANIARRDKYEVHAMTESASSAAFASKAGSRALKNFSRLFKEVPEANWYITNDDGFAAVYDDHGSKCTAIFSQNGHFVYSISRHSVDQLPQHLVNDVTKAFDGYKVICGEEIWVDGKSIFLVHIQSYTKSKTVRIADNEMEVIEELTRS